MENEYAAFVNGLEQRKQWTTKSIEYWMGRDLMDLLGYVDWRNFNAVIDRAVIAARSAKVEAKNHFVETNNMVEIGSGATRDRQDWFLTRYACYLIAMNGEAGKRQVGFAMTYFADKTRKQEVAEVQHELAIEQERLRLRLRLIDNTKQLNTAAKKAGVERFALFHDAGIRGMYNRGLTELKALKGLGENENHLDHADRLELSANDFRTTLAEHRLTQERISSEAEAVQTHREVGEEVRMSVSKKNGVTPENLPKAPSIKKLVSKHQRQLKSGKLSK